MIFLWQLENIRTPFFNEIMQFVTYFGQELLIIAVICALYWCADKRFAYYLGFTYFTAGFCVQALKITFRIPRPWILDPEFKAVKSAIPAATGYSFPSGHTQGATCLFFPLALRAKKAWAKHCLYSHFYVLVFPECISDVTHQRMFSYLWVCPLSLHPFSGISVQNLKMLLLAPHRFLSCSVYSHSLSPAMHGIYIMDR